MHLVHTKRAPQYLSDSVRTVARSSSRPGLRSSNTAVYAKPRCRTKFGERGFSHAGPTAWNSLPHHLHQISDTGLFKCRLKTELFRRAYVASYWTIRKQRYRKMTVLLLPARRYASAGNSDRNVSVRLSVTRRYCVKTKTASGMISSPSGGPKTLVFRC